MVGRSLVGHLLGDGHRVTAVTRSGTLDIHHDALRTVQGDVGDASGIAERIQGHDVVVNATGNRDYQSPVLVSHPAVLAVTAALTEEQRLITVGAVSMLQFDEASLWKTHQSPELNAYVRYPIIDHFASWEHLRDHACDWVMVCPPMLVDAEADGNYVTRETYWPDDAKKEVAAGNVAHFIAAELRDRKHRRVRVGIGTPAVGAHDGVS